MDFSFKGRSPFYPGQPVPPEFFVGRKDEIQKLERALHQVSTGSQRSVYLTGEYGIGKSSLASYSATLAYEKLNLVYLHILLSGIKTLEDLTIRLVDEVLKSALHQPKTGEKIKNWLSKYVSNQSAFGFTLNLVSLKKDLPKDHFGILNFLAELLENVKDEGIKGIILIFDELNGISKTVEFAMFLKGLVDQNAVNKIHLPFLLLVCSTDDRRKEMIELYEPIDRVFDVVNISLLNDTEVTSFFNNSFSSIGYSIDESAMTNLVYYSQGYPKIMQEIGDEVFWATKGERVEYRDSIEGIQNAAINIGRKFVDNQVVDALHSEKYKNILSAISKFKTYKTIKKSEVESLLKEPEKKVFNNFIQRMKNLGVLRSEGPGEYIFTNRMIQTYLILTQGGKK